MYNIFVIFAILIGCQASEPTPIVIWHGMGDSCCNPLSMGSVMKMIDRHLPGVYIHSLQIGNGFMSDTLNGFFKPIPEQVTMACDKIRADPKLENGFNAIGFSQGGQFLRAVVQQCGDIKMNSLITFGAQHQGVYGLPNCPPSVTFCDSIRDLLNKAAYNPIVQNRLVQAEYWHDAVNTQEYLTKNIFLPDINNENVINQMYKDRLTSLNKFVMVKHLNDTMVEPLESEWFGFYEVGSDQKEVPLQETDLYKNDLLGLKQMEEDGKLVFLATEGEHLQFTEQWFVTNILQYLQN